MVESGVPSQMTWLLVVGELTRAKVGSEMISMVPETVEGLHPPPVVMKYV